MIDAGAPRSVANLLEADQIKNATGVVATAHYIHGWLRGAAEFRTKPPRTLLDEIARRYEPDLQPLIPIARRASRQTIVEGEGRRGSAMMTPAVGTFCAWLEGTPEGLIGRLSDWQDEDAVNHSADAVALFRTALLKRGGKHLPTGPRVAISLFIEAKNLDHTGEALPPKGLDLQVGGQVPDAQVARPRALGCRPQRRRRRRVSEFCTSCKAPIRWAVTIAGYPMPIDPDPAPDGNLHLETVLADEHQIPRVWVVPLAQRTGDDAGQLYKAHFVTCPYADQHRRRR